MNFIISSGSCLESQRQWGDVETALKDGHVLDHWSELQSAGTLLLAQLLNFKSSV